MTNARARTSSAVRARVSIADRVLDEQRLLAYEKENKCWDWNFGKFPGRTPAAVRTRCSAQRLLGFLPQVDRLQAVAQALCVYLSLGVCRDECLKGTLSFWPAPTRFSRNREYGIRDIIVGKSLVLCSRHEGGRR